MSRACLECGRYFRPDKPVRKYCSRLCGYEYRRRQFPTIAERMDSATGRGGPDDCWPWMGQRDKAGYGSVYVRYRRAPQKAHRVAYELAHGSIPEGLCVLHQCDNTSCVNPRHLSVGTRTDNARERDQRRRTSFGERNGQARLSEADVISIRRRMADGENSHALAAEYGIGERAIRDIVSRRRES